MMRLDPVSIGDIVDVVAPASACSLKELHGGVRALRQLGYEPRVPQNIFAKSVLFSNSDEQRLKQFKAAIYAKDSNIIWCLRGGYGALRLLPEMRKWRPPRHPKIFIGYSDITTLHVFLNQEWGWPTLHGPMLSRLGRGPLRPKAHMELFGLLNGVKSEIEFTGLEPLNAEARQKKRVKAPVLGGNMAVLQSGLGTPGSLAPGRAIFFF
jgi:muramoyltetrapeptide carboxypeptidase